LISREIGRRDDVDHSPQGHAGQEEEQQQQQHQQQEEEEKEAHFQPN
jgi:hypothetical protein